MSSPIQGTVVLNESTKRTSCNGLNINPAGGGYALPGIAKEYISDWISLIDVNGKLLRYTRSSIICNDIRMGTCTSRRKVFIKELVGQDFKFYSVIKNIASRTGIRSLAVASGVDYKEAKNPRS